MKKKLKRVLTCIKEVLWHFFETFVIMMLLISLGQAGRTVPEDDDGDDDAPQKALPEPSKGTDSAETTERKEENHPA